MLVCVFVCAPPLEATVTTEEEACEHAGHMTEPAALVTHKTETCKTQCRVQHRNLCRHCLCLFVHGKCIFNPAGHVLLRFILHYYTLLVQPFICALQICQVHSSACWPVTEAASFAPLPSPPHPTSPHLVPGCYLLIIQSGAVCHTFVPSPVAAKMKIIWLWTLQKNGCRMVPFISPIIGVRKIHVVGDRITCNHII